jgi:hypothetical protein
MGGGWAKAGSGVPLGERVRVGRPERAQSCEPVCPGRHCWVSDAVDGRGVKRPGLLIEWRRVGGGWEGRVVYLSLLRPTDAPEGDELGGGWVLVEEWLAAHRLAPK